MRPRIHLHLGLLLTTACAPQWTAAIEPARVWSGAEAERVLQPCTRRVPGPVDSLFTPDSASIAQLQAALPELLTRQQWAERGGVWHLRGEFAGFFSGDHRFVYGSYESWREGERAPELRPNPMNWCDGGRRFFGVTFEVGAGRIVRFDPNEVGMVESNR